MQLGEFDKNMARLKDKWKTIFSSDQLSLLWNRWSTLPDGVFETSVQMILFKCTSTPSGERVQEEIDLTLEIRRRSSAQRSEPKNNGCKSCNGWGYQTAYNLSGNECPFRCTTCGAKGLDITHPIPTWGDVMNRGYTKKKKPLSADAKKHPEWKEADKTKYSPKLIGIYNTIQRSMLMNDQRGLNGIRKVLSIPTEDAFKIYELMLQENKDHDLIKKNNVSVERVL